MGDDKIISLASSCLDQVNYANGTNEMPKTPNLVKGVSNVRIVTKKTGLLISHNNKTRADISMSRSTVQGRLWIVHICTICMLENILAVELESFWLTKQFGTPEQALSC